MWVQPRIDAAVRDEAEDRDPDRLVNLTYCRAIRVRGVRASESNGVGGLEPVDDTSNSADTPAPVLEPETPTYRRWEVVAALAVERAAPGSRTTEILAAVATENVARGLFREIRGALLDGRLGLDLSADGDRQPGRAVATGAAAGASGTSATASGATPPGTATARGQRRQKRRVVPQQLPITGQFRDEVEKARQRWRDSGQEDTVEQQDALRLTERDG